MRFCDGTCRMRAWRIGGYVHSRQRARFARQPIPKFHQSPALLRVASHQRRRADASEKSNQDLQQQRSVLAQENDALKLEVAELRRQLDEARRAQQATGHAPGNGQGPRSGPRGERQRGASADRPEQDLATRLRHCQQMYRELSAVAEELRHIHEAEQKRSADLDRLLQEALALAIDREPPLSGDWSAESAANVQRRSAILTTENEQLHRNVAEVAAERQQLSARLLSILLPGQAAAHASGLNYDVSRDPLIPQKRLELTLLDAYAVWQSRNMRHVTARTLDPNKTLDEQALEAALAARWRLITQPPLEVRNRLQPPRWTAIGFCLDPASERYLLRQSQRRMDEMRDRMRAGSGGNAPD